MDSEYLLSTDGNKPISPNDYKATDKEGLRKIAVQIVKDKYGINVNPKCVEIDLNKKELKVKIHELPVQIIEFKIIESTIYE